MALSNETIRPYTWIKGYRTEYVSKRQLLRQRSNREFLWDYEVGVPLHKKNLKV